jgi:hypothetical protein
MPNHNLRSQIRQWAEQAVQATPTLTPPNTSASSSGGAPSLAGGVQVMVELPHGESLPVVISPAECVWQLRQRLMSKLVSSSTVPTNPLPITARMRFNAHMLRDERTLASYGIHVDASAYYVVRVSLPSSTNLLTVDCTPMPKGATRAERERDEELRRTHPIARMLVPADEKVALLRWRVWATSPATDRDKYRPSKTTIWYGVESVGDGKLQGTVASDKTNVLQLPLKDDDRVELHLSNFKPLKDKHCGPLAR